VDERVAERLRGNAIADRVFYAASALGDHGLVWLILADLHALGAADRWRSWLRVAGALGVESIIVNGPVKWVFRRQRPEAKGEARLPLRTPHTSSFPSGHATSAFCAATLLSEADPRRRGAYFTMAAVVAWSRVHVRLHHASDVIGGAAIGTVLGVVAKRLVPLRPRPARGRG
jgi:undecaprenyl-diphosphatase